MGVQEGHIIHVRLKSGRETVGYRCFRRRVIADLIQCVSSFKKPRSLRIPEEYLAGILVCTPRIEGNLGRTSHDDVQKARQSDTPQRIRLHLACRESCFRSYCDPHKAEYGNSTFAKLFVQQLFVAVCQTMSSRIVHSLNCEYAFEELCRSRRAQYKPTLTSRLLFR